MYEIVMKIAVGMERNEASETATRTDAVTPRKIMNTPRT